jgi:DNA gyrase subunit A
LNKRYLLSEEQGKSILEMRLQRLTGLEQEKIYAELEEVKNTVKFLLSIVENEKILSRNY